MLSSKILIAVCLYVSAICNVAVLWHFTENCVIFFIVLTQLVTVSTQCFKMITKNICDQSISPCNKDNLSLTCPVDK